MVIVCVNRDAAFHGGKGDLGTIANKVSEICKAAGALVTENDRLWRMAHALSGKSYKIPGTSNLQYYLLKQKPIDVLAPSLDFIVINDLEEICVNSPVIKDMLFRLFFGCFLWTENLVFFRVCILVKTSRFSERFFCRKSWGGRGALMFGQSGGSESCFCYVSC